MKLAHASKLLDDARRALEELRTVYREESSAINPKNFFAIDEDSAKGIIDSPALKMVLQSREMHER